MRLLLLAVLLLTGACTAGRAPVTAPPAATDVLADATWSGRVLIDGTVTVAKGAVLTVAPGTEVAFLRRDRDGDGLGDGTLVVEGELRALGTFAEPIVFRSAAADPRPGDWLEIRADFSRGLHLRHCLLRDSAYTLHAHFTRGVMEDCTVRGNIDGCRLGQSRFTIRNCLVEENSGKGINFRNSEVEIVANIIRRNGSGIFLFETDRPYLIRDNNLHHNLENFRLGDFFTGDVALAGNWWGSADPREAAASVYDRKRDPALGRVELDPAASWRPGTGPRDPLAAFVPAWEHATGGFVDAPPLAAGETLYVASWDGTLARLDRRGSPLWSRQLGEVIDGGLAAGAGAVYAQTWGREVFALAAEDGALRWRFGYPASPADDHRQGGPLLAGGLLVVPAWNGTLYALDPESGLVVWSRELGLPLRATPATDGDRLYVAGGDGRLSALALSGELLWQANLGAPLLAKPLVTGAGPVVLARDGRLCAFDRDGGLRWQRALEDACFYAAPVAAGDAVVAATSAGRVFKVDAADGALLWVREGLGPVYATPLVTPERIFVGDNDGRLTALGRESGDVLARLVLEREIQGGPVAFGPGLVFGARDQRLHAVGLATGAAGPPPGGQE